MNDLPEKATAPADLPAAGDPRVRLYVGTSEDSLPHFLDGPTPRQYLTARQKVRGVAERFAGKGNVPDEQVDELLRFNSSIRSRAHETGQMIYTTYDRVRAEGYAGMLAAKGGEFASHIRVKMGAPWPKQDVRPVLLTLDVPKSAIAYENDHETLVRAGPDIKVASVVFASKWEGGTYKFLGQPELTPQQARADARPTSRAPDAAPPADPLQQHILRTLDEFSREPGVKIAYNATYVAETRVKDTAGAERTLRVPDMTFRPQAREAFANNGLRGVAADYVMPHDLTPIELNSFLDVLDAREQAGRLAPAAKAAELKALLNDFTQANPALKSLDFDRTDPARLGRVMRGIVNGYSPENLQFDQTGMKDAAYDSLRERASQGLKSDISLAPETLRGIEAQIPVLPPVQAARLAQARAAAAPLPVPAAPPPEPDAYGRVAAQAKAPTAVIASDAPASRFARTAQAHLGAGVGAAAVALDLADGNVKGALTAAGQQLALSPATMKALAALTRDIAPVGKVLGAVGKRIPLVGAAVTLGYVGYEVAEDAMHGEQGKAGAAAGAGLAEIGGNLVGFGVGDAARETVREAVVLTAGETYAPDKSGLRALGEKTVELAHRVLPAPAKPPGLSRLNKPSV